MSTERARRPRADDGLTIVGLVGRAGSGKSSVARVLAADGAVVLAADALGHAVTDGEPEVRAALAAEYGADVYRADGALDRAKVAAKVFADPAARARLDALVHPRIVRRLRAELDRLRAGGWRGVVVVDAALMLDWGFERECDAVLAVTAAEADRVARQTRARGWSEDETRARLAAQRTDDAFAAAADETIDNRGSEADLARAARAALARIVARRQRDEREGAGTC